MIVGGYIHAYKHYMDITSICGAADDTWKTVDVSGYVPPEAKYVLLYIKNPFNVDNSYWFGVRPKGTDWSDSVDVGHEGNRIHRLHQKFVIMKLNDDLEFEMTRSNVNIDVWLAGWADGAITFLDSRVDITPTANDAWEEKDLSSHIPADATGVYVKIVNSDNSWQYCGIRERGSTNGYLRSYYRTTKWLSSGVDVDRKVETYKDSPNITIYLVGYYIPPVHFLTNKINREPAGNGFWANVDISGVFPTDNIDFAFFSTNNCTNYVGILPSNGSGGDKGLHYGGHGAFAYIVPTTTYYGYTQDDGQTIYCEGYQEMDTSRYMLDLNVEDQNQYPFSEVVNMTGPYGFRWVRKTFIHNNLFWIFYVGTDSKCYYTTSSDGINWSSGIYLHDTSYQYGVTCSIWFDGTHVHVFVKDSPKQYYRKGTPNADGTITWDADWQVSMQFVPNPSTIGDHTGCVDKDGFPWVAWTMENGDGGVGALEIWVNGSQNNDGTWTDLAGYPKDITNGTVADNYREGYLVPYPASRDLYIILIRGNQPLRGRKYTQATDTWNAVETISTSNAIETYAIGGEMWSCSAVVDQWGHIHVIFQDSANRLIYLRKDFHTGVWSDETVLATSLPTNSTPVMAIDYSTDDLFIFYGKNNRMYLIKGVNWHVGGISTEWVNATLYGGLATGGGGAGTDGMISVQRRVTNNLLITLMSTGSSSPYSYRIRVFKVGKTNITIDEETKQTPWKMSLLQTSSLEVTMPETFGSYPWIYWKEDEDINRTKTILMNPSDKGYTGYYAVSPTLAPPTYGGWWYRYRFRPEPNFKVKAPLIVPIEETKRIRGKVSNFFEETIKTIGRKLADTFQETKPIIGTLFVKFTETSPTMGNIVKKFEETKLVKALVFIWFVDKERVYGETKSLEEDVLEELERITEND